MMGRLFSLVFLGGLAFGAVHLPSLLRNLAQQSSEKRLQNSTAPVIETGNQIEHVYIQERSLVSDKAKENMESEPQAQVMMNPMIGALLEESRARKKNSSTSHLSWQEKLSTWFTDQVSTVERSLWPILGGFLVLGFVFLLLGYKGWARTCVSFCHGLSQMWLFLLSGVTVLLFFIGKGNLFLLAPTVFWSAPVVSILVSLVLFRWIDVNFPLWNSTFVSFLFPIGSYVVVLMGASIGAPFVTNSITGKGIK